MPALTVTKFIHACCPESLRPSLTRIEASEVAYRLAKGTFWSLIGITISQSLMLVSTILMARILGKTGYGELGMIKSTVGMFGVFAGFGLGLTATKHVAEFRKSDPERAGRILGLSGLVALVTGGLMTLVLVIFAPWLASHTINAPHLAGVLRISAVMLFISALNGAQTGALSGFEAFKTIARINLLAGIISFPMLVCGTYFGGLTGAVWALAGNSGINWLLSHLAIRKEANRCGIRLTFGDCGRDLPILWKFTLPAVLASALHGPIGWISNALLANQPRGYGELGIFSIANQWQAVILFVPAAVSQITLPMLSNLNTPKEQSKYIRVLRYNLLISGTITIAVSLPVIVFSKFIMGMYGNGFEEGWFVLILLTCTAVLIMLTGIVGRVLASKDMMWIGFFLNGLWATSLIGLSWLMVRYGARGIATAYLISYVFHLINTLLFTKLFIINKTRPSK